MESYQTLRDEKKKEAVEYLFKCIDHLRSIAPTNDPWPWVQLTYALTAFDAGLYDLSLNSSQLVQVREDDHVSLSAEKANEAVKASDLDEIERYLHHEKMLPAKLFPRFRSRT